MPMTYQIKGMHCASCAVKIEKAFVGVSGVTRATVNFATETAQVEGDAGFDALQAAVARVGGYQLIELTADSRQPQATDRDLSAIGYRLHHTITRRCGALSRGALAKWERRRRRN